MNEVHRLEAYATRKPTLQNIQETKQLHLITKEPIDTNDLLKRVSDPHCGATVLFLGSTRQWTKGRETKWLEYDGYIEMALAEMKRLEEEALATWPIRNVAMVHRLGRIEIGETSVAVAVGSPHRGAAFTAGKWLIDELKKQVPIWKKEIFADSDPEWVHNPPVADVDSEGPPSTSQHPPSLDSNR